MYNPSLHDTEVQLLPERYSYTLQADGNYRLVFRAGAFHSEDETATHSLRLRDVVGEVEKLDPTL